MNTISFGDQGENIAIEYLTKKGYSILAKKFRYRHYEVDIIAKEGDEIVFVEVKSRTASFVIHPSMAVTKKKQKNIISAAAAFIEMNNIDFESRFDILTVIQENSTYKIEHITSAYSPSWK
jgi:putative endonuclease